MYLYTLKQHTTQAKIKLTVVNRFKKNVSLHVETTVSTGEWVEGSCESL